MCCKKYVDLRRKHLPTALYTKPSMFKFVAFLNKEDTEFLKKLGVFLYYVFKRYEKDELLA